MRSHVLLQVRGPKHPAAEPALGDVALALPSGLGRAHHNSGKLVGGGELGQYHVEVEVILCVVVVNLNQIKDLNSSFPNRNHGVLR